MPLRNVRAEPLSSTSIRVHWDPIDGKGQNDGKPINGYRVRWIPVDGHKTNEPIEQLTLTENATFVLTDLAKWSQYRIQVSAYNRAGEGPPAAVTARTLEDLPGPVGQIHFRDVLLDTLKVLWNPPVGQFLGEFLAISRLLKTETNGNLTAFLVLYRTNRHGAGEANVVELFPRKVSMN